MVRLTRNKPYTLHARSLDRITGTPSDYKLNLRDPITCADDHHIKATFVSCTAPPVSKRPCSAARAPYHSAVFRPFYLIRPSSWERELHAHVLRLCRLYMDAPHHKHR